MANPARWLVVNASIVLLIGGCQKSDEKSAADTVAQVPLESAPPGPPATRPNAPAGCVHTGLWAVCSVERRLRQSGFVPKKLTDDAPTRAGFSVKPLVYSLGRSRLEVFLYESAADVERDVATLDTVLVVPRGSTTSPWESTPILIRSGNLAAVFLASSPLQAERLSLALTAGAPQPGSPR